MKENRRALLQLKGMGEILRRFYHRGYARNIKAVFDPRSCKVQISFKRIFFHISVNKIRKFLFVWKASQQDNGLCEKTKINNSFRLLSLRSTNLQTFVSPSAAGRLLVHSCQFLVAY